MSLTVALYTSFVFVVIYAVTRCIYNLFMHPLRKIPGPKLAGICSIYDFYYDVVKGGTYLWKIREMHDRYGKSNVKKAKGCPLTGI
jgi:hypothetical protein